MSARKKEETNAVEEEKKVTEEQEVQEEPETPEEPEEPETPKEKKSGKLVATRPIIYQGRQFATGEQLPNYDEDMVEAWLKYGSAKYE